MDTMNTYPIQIKRPIPIQGESNGPYVSPGDKIRTDKYWRERMEVDRLHPLYAADQDLQHEEIMAILESKKVEQKQLEAWDKYQTDYLKSYGIMPINLFIPEIPNVFKKYCLLCEEVSHEFNMENLKMGSYCKECTEYNSLKCPLCEDIYYKFDMSEYELGMYCDNCSEEHLLIQKCLKNELPIRKNVNYCHLCEDKTHKFTRENFKMGLYCDLCTKNIFKCLLCEGDGLHIFDMKKLNMYCDNCTTRHIQLHHLNK